ncbi:MAG: amidohydrolase family protein [Candidatus Binataceae bacterium]
MARIIDADGHIVEPRALWEEYTEPAYRDRIIQIRRNSQGVDEFWINGKPQRSVGRSVATSVIPGGFLDTERARNATWDDVLPGSYDPHERIKVMDAERIDVAVLYPSLWLVYGDFDDPKVAVAACRAYNNWMADFCKPYPKRLYGVAPMPLQDVDEAVKEMRRVVKELNFKAVFVRPNPFNGRRLNDPAYEPFWREAQELDIPVAIHSSFGTRMPTLGGDRYRDPFFFHMVCHPFEQQAACMDIICGGVLARYPRLKLGFLESGVGWVGYWLDRMDGHYEKMGTMVPWLKKRPTEYFMERCYLSFDPDERTLGAMVELGFDKNILWGSDYPHFDCTYPGIVAEIEKACSTLPASARHSILTENAIRFYNLT